MNEVCVILYKSLTEAKSSLNKKNKNAKYTILPN